MAAVARQEDYSVAVIKMMQTRTNKARQVSRILSRVSSGSFGGLNESNISPINQIKVGRTTPVQHAKNQPVISKHLSDPVAKLIKVENDTSPLASAACPSYCIRVFTIRSNMSF